MEIVVGTDGIETSWMPEQRIPQGSTPKPARGTSSTSSEFSSSNGHQSAGVAPPGSSGTSSVNSHRPETCDNGMRSR